MRLPQSNVQEWHHILLKAIVEGTPYSGLCHMTNPDRVQELESNHLIQEAGVLAQAKRGRNPKMFKLTEAGNTYYGALSSEYLFDVSKWGQSVAFLEMFKFYAISGDLRAIFPQLLFILRSPDFSNEQKQDIACFARNTQNGYMVVIAQLYLTYGVTALHWFDDSHTPYIDWQENGVDMSKAMNIRLSHVGYDAFNRIIAKLDTMDLRTGPYGRVASEGLSAELALIVMASLLEQLL